MLRASKVIVATAALNDDEMISGFTDVTDPVPRALSAQFISRSRHRAYCVPR